MALAVATSPFHADAQDRGISARSALDQIGTTYTSLLTQRVVEMVGKRGQPQPREWEAVVHDERSAYRLRTMKVIRERRVIDEGENDDFYPSELPIGFFSTSKLRIDSPAAFSVLEREATRAKIGFDAVDYKLRSIEFGDEPIWSLTARDDRGRVVGRVILSGLDGRLLRTVWFYKTPSGNPRIVDSALDGQQRSTTSPVPAIPPPVIVPPASASPEPDPRDPQPPRTPGADPFPEPAPINPPSRPDPLPLEPAAPPRGNPGTEEAEVTEITDP